MVTGIRFPMQPAATNSVSTPSLWRRFALTLEMIKFEHSVFALPFALTGALAASRAQLDIVGFVFIAALTAVGGGTGAVPAPSTIFSSGKCRACTLCRATSSTRPTICTAPARLEVGVRISVNCDGAMPQ